MKTEIVDLIKIIEKHGVDDLRFLVGMRPIRKAFFIGYTSTSDPEEKVICRITEEKYKLANNFKIELVAENKKFGKESFYISDLNSLIRQGTVRMFLEI